MQFQLQTTVSHDESHPGQTDTCACVHVSLHREHTYARAWACPPALPCVTATQHNAVSPRGAFRAGPLCRVEHLEAPVKFQNVRGGKNFKKHPFQCPTFWIRKMGLKETCQNRPQLVTLLTKGTPHFSGLDAPPSGPLKCQLLPGYFSLSRWTLGSWKAEGLCPVSLVPLTVLPGEVLE